MTRKTQQLLAAMGAAVVSAAALGQVGLAVDFDPAPGIQDTVIASAGDTVTAALVVWAPNAGVLAYEFSARFDPVELTASAANELVPTGFGFNLTPGVRSVGPSFVEGFEAAILPGPGPAGTSFVAGTIEFVVTDAINDGAADVTPGLLGIDGGFGSNAFLPLAITDVSPGFVIGQNRLDCDGNGVVNISDLFCFINLFTMTPPDPSTDFDGNGIINISDLFAYINAFTAQP
ncbi:MAG: GC-type dockerin domain-anchored protein [Planctomycetota bacterium]